MFAEYSIILVYGNDYDDEVINSYFEEIRLCITGLGGTINLDTDLNWHRFAYRIRDNNTKNYVDLGLFHKYNFSIETTRINDIKVFINSMFNEPLRYLIQRLDACNDLNKILIDEDRK